MEQVPQWLEAAVFAAGMTAYAEGLDGVPGRAVAAEREPARVPSLPPDAIH